MPRIPLMLWVGTVITPYGSGIHNFEPITVAYNSATSPSNLAKRQHLSFVRPVHDRTITTRKQFRRLTITVILIAWGFCICRWDFMSPILSKVTSDPKVPHGPAPEPWTQVYRSYRNPWISRNGRYCFVTMVTEEGWFFDDGQYYKSWVE
jgi:hypothetical protein